MTEEEYILTSNERIIKTMKDMARNLIPCKELKEQNIHDLVEVLYEVDSRCFVSIKDLG
jgi:hypothetical protein